jgi:hypothetical protein
MYVDKILKGLSPPSRPIFLLTTSPRAVSSRSEWGPSALAEGHRRLASVT